MINPNSNCIAPVIIVEYIAKMINEISMIERIVNTNGSPIAIVFKYFIVFMIIYYFKLSEIIESYD